MSTVQRWAQKNNYRYVFIDDRIFKRVPNWYFKKVKGQINLVTDLARLLLAQDFLNNGYECSIWIDADVVICDPDSFSIEQSREFAFCREIWIGLHRFSFHLKYNINNAVMVFRRGNRFLENYIEDALRIVKTRDDLKWATVSTFYLTEKYKELSPFLLKDVGLLSPMITKDIASSNGPAAAAYYMLQFGHRVNAVNLCASFSGKPHQGVTLQEDDYTTAVKKLIHNRGNLLNQHITPGAGANVQRTAIKALLSLMRQYRVARYNLKTLLALNE